MEIESVPLRVADPKAVEILHETPRNPATDGNARATREAGKREVTTGRRRFRAFLFEQTVIFYGKGMNGVIAAIQAKSKAILLKAVSEKRAGLATPWLMPVFRTAALLLVAALLLIVAALLGASAALAVQDEAPQEGMAAGAGHRGGALPIVTGGQAKAVVLLPEDADAQLQKAAATLVEYVQKATGAVLPVMTEADLKATGGPLNGHVRIYIDTADSTDDPHVPGILAGMDRDGFVIHPHGNSITIAGPSVWGTLNGVFDFLERYVDVRWLLPGPDGEDVPQQSSIAVPRQNVVEEPAFTYRAISPYTGNPDDANDRQAYSEWAQRNKLQGGYNWEIYFMHNLHSVFPVDRFGETNPEFYPNGRPPAPGVNTGWQPCFTAEGSVDAAVQVILEFFAANPDRRVFSLGVNDSGGYCEANPSHPHYPNKLNSIGLVDMSDIYYDWVNQVVEQVLQVYPDKWFGLLAYQNVMDPPSFPLHERVIPYITKDRMAWTDDGIRAAGHAQVEQWQQVANHLAWYDYMYGVFYMLPRIYPHIMAENFRYAKEHDVIANYTEMYHNIADGPKPWVSAKLQWDPYQDVDELLDEWYERAVGPAAAPDLKAYYELWEEFWTERIKQSEWFETGKNSTYLPFTDASYLNLVTEADLTTGRSLLESVVAKAQTAPQKARAERLLQMFEYYEAAARSYPTDVAELTNEAEALAFVDAFIGNLDERLYLAQRRHELIDEFSSDTLLRFLIAPRVDWTGWNKSGFWAIVDYIQANEPGGGAVTSRLEQIAETGDANASAAAKLALQAGMGLLPLTQNASFEDGVVNAPPWTFWIVTEGTMERTESFARTGGASLVINGLDRGGPAQTFPVEAGVLAARVYYYTEPGWVPDGATVQLALNVKNAAGQNLKVLQTSAQRLAKTNGEWASIELLEEIPEEIDGQTPTQAQLVVIVNRFSDGANLYIDDAYVYQYSETLVKPSTFWELADQLAAGGPQADQLRQRIEEIASGTEPSDEREYARLLLDMVPINENRSFEDGTTNAPPWGFWLTGQGAISRTEDEARSGTASLLVDGIRRGGPFQHLVPTPGPFAVRGYYKLPEGITTQATVQVQMNLINAAGQVMGNIQSPTTRLQMHDWAPFEYVGMIPADVDGVPVTRVQLVVIINAQESDRQVYLDDVTVYQTGN